MPFVARGVVAVQLGPCKLVLEKLEVVAASLEKTRSCLDKDIHCQHTEAFPTIHSTGLDARNDRN